jgi:hypothetical protein
MIGNTSSRIEHHKKTTEYTYPQIRRGTRIENGDWERWVRLIQDIPEHERNYRDAAFACAAFGAEGILSAIGFFVTRAPSCISILFLLVGIGSSVAATMCFLFDSKMAKVISVGVEQVLQDMEEVRERSSRFEEMTTAEEREIKGESG